VILLHQVVDVLRDVLPHNALLVAVRVVPFPVTVVTRETLLRLWDIQATVRGALKRREGGREEGGREGWGE